MEEKLIGLAAELSRDITPSQAYTLEDLRQYTVVRIRDDYEMADIFIGEDGLLDALTTAILRPV